MLDLGRFPVSVSARVYRAGEQRKWERCCSAVEAAVAVGGSASAVRDLNYCTRMVILSAWADNGGKLITIPLSVRLSTGF